MKLNAGLHLAYCTRVHRGETWAEAFESLQNHTLQVRERVCPGEQYAIGLRLSHRAAHELAERSNLLEFHRWLGKHRCYVFTIDGFCHGRAHGPRIGEMAYEPDWRLPERVAYTNLLFELLSQLLPETIEGSVSTLPCSYKGFRIQPDEWKIIRDNLWHCVEHIARVSEQTGRRMYLALEPEPLCCLESSGETVHFFDRMRSEHPRDPALAEHLSVNYDTCHFAVEFEEPHNAMGCLLQHGVKISKIHLSSALKVSPVRAAREALAQLPSDGRLHQVVVRRADGQRVIHGDLAEALANEPEEPPATTPGQPGGEWRIHLHVPLHTPASDLFESTSDHVLGVLDLLWANPGLCSHLEIETDTWGMLPDELRERELADQIASEYEWILAGLTDRGLANYGGASLAGAS